ncbi:MAG: tetratricopeptide repeat protein [Flavobacteriaceae bacterium]|nr:tetratricopeptide repeat protein [Flavobacteriaceae bacterium]
MKYLFTLILGLLVTLGYAQKKELRQAQKFFKASKIEEAKTSLSANQAIIEGSDDAKIKTQYHFLKGQIARLDKDFQASYDNLKLAEGNSALKAALTTEIQQLTSDIVNAAIAQSEAKEFIPSSENLYLAYQINPEENKDYLYYAATNAVNGSDYNIALEHYIQLRDINYTGVVTKYYVTDVASGEETEVSATEFGIYKKSKDYTNARSEDTESKYPEIVKNIALIYTELGQKDNAMKAVQDARKANPGDVGLILTEANIYIQLGEKQRYKELITEALEKDPSNAVLYFNLGVVNSEQGDSVLAREYYEKAIEIDPSMENAYLNLVALILENESKIVEQMNSLGNSRADNLKYDELKKERETLYKECVPVLKQLIALDDSNLEAVQTLRNIYGTIGDNEGFMEMKAIMEKYEQ